MDDHDVSALLVMVTDKRRPSDRAKMEKEGEERKGKERRREQGRGGEGRGERRDLYIPKTR